MGHSMTANTLRILYTGGTIGMVPSDNGLKPSANQLEQAVRQHFQAQWPELKLLWHTREPLLDSSQAQPKDWLSLAEFVMTHCADNIPIVILHGTDTLAYTSSALSMMLPNLHPIVVLTGSQYPWQFEQSDGPNNLTLAAQCALTATANTVYLAFHGKLFMGSHVTKYNAIGYDGFVAPHGVQHLQNPSRQNNLRKIYPKRIEVVTCYPGTQYKSLPAVLDTHPDFLIIRALGAGNIPNPSTLQSILNTKKVPLLINISQCLIANPTLSQYAINHELLQFPWLDCQTMTFEALFCKLHLLDPSITQPAEVNAFLTTPLDHEIPQAVSHLK